MLDRLLNFLGCSSSSATANTQDQEEGLTNRLARKKKAENEAAKHAQKVVATTAISGVVAYVDPSKKNKEAFVKNLKGLEKAADSSMNNMLSRDERDSVSESAAKPYDPQKQARANAIYERFKRKVESEQARGG